MKNYTTTEANHNAQFTLENIEKIKELIASPNSNSFTVITTSFIEERVFGRKFGVITSDNYLFTHPNNLDYLDFLLIKKIDIPYEQNYEKEWRFVIDKKNIELTEYITPERVYFTIGKSQDFKNKILLDSISINIS